MLIFDQLTKKDPQLRVVTWVVLLGMGILLTGLWYVQVVSYSRYSEDQKTQSFRTVRIPAIRGKVLDREGRSMAENQPSFQVSLYVEEVRELFAKEWRRSLPPKVTNTHQIKLLGIPIYTYEKVQAAYKLTPEQRKERDIQIRWRVISNIVDRLSQVIGAPVNLEPERFFTHYNNQLALPLPLATNLTPAQVARFQEQPSSIPGLDLEIQPLRVYPYRTNAAHMLGYLVRDDESLENEEAFFNYRMPDYRGVIGVEWAFDAELRGKAGVKSVMVNNLGYRQSETVWAPAEAGSNVVLTIDMEIQQAAETALQSVVSKYRPVRGAVVVMDPREGDLLAVVSSPAFDPNVFIPRIRAEDLRLLLDEEVKPQRNRATQENYQPGSVFKIVTSLACLDAGLNPSDKIYNPPAPNNPHRGHIQVGRRVIHDTAEPGEYDFRRAFIKSSNTYFISNGLHYGVEQLIQIGQRLHLGERVNLPTRQDNGGMFPSPTRIQAAWFDGHTANLCIGQGDIAMTPLQVAVLVSAIANGGKVLWPRLVTRIEPQDFGPGFAARVFRSGQVRDELRVSPQTLGTITSAMLADVEEPEGTGKAATIPGFRVCGKTGTAQVTDQNNRVVDQTTWFASYAPYEQPRYVVIVMVEGGASGGGTCAPVARKIYQALHAREQRLRAAGNQIARN